MECYIRAMEQCYQRLKEKQLGKNLLADSHYVCFHTPFAKMIQKAFKALSQLESKNVLEEQIETDFAKKVESSLYISRRVGNIYTGSLFAGLISLLVNEP